MHPKRRQSLPGFLLLIRLIFLVGWLLTTGGVLGSEDLDSHCTFQGPTGELRTDPLFGELAAWSNPEFRLGSGPRESLLSVVIDTTESSLVFQIEHADGSVLATRVLDRESYLEYRLSRANPKALREALVASVGSRHGGGDGHIEIDIPFKVKSQTFRRIFGSGRIGLNVTGNINLSGTYHTEKRESESASVMNDNRNDFRLEQTQQFQVVGKIGEKVDVHIDQDTERSFDFENNLSITYTGEAEEIIEKIEAGNIALSLPSTKYVQFSDRSSGLFGLKMVTRFGPLRLTGVASSEKNESKQQTFEGGSSTSSIELGPGEWVPKIFFVNEYYRHQYRIYDQNMDHLLGPRIISFDLYVFETDRTASPPGVFLFSPQLEAEFHEQPYEVRRISWIEGESQEFWLDPDLGTVRLMRPVRDNEFIAMAYEVDRPDYFASWTQQTGRGIFTGNMAAQDGDSAVVLVPENFGHTTQPYWDLMLKNVYLAANIDVDPNEFGLEIVENVSGSTGRTAQDGVNYLSIFHLDVRNNAQSSPGSDQKVDAQWLDPRTGELWFPSPYPFGDRPDGAVMQSHPDSTATLTDPQTGQTVSYTGYYLAPNVGQGQAGPNDFVPFGGAAEMDTLYDLRGRDDILWLEKNSLFSIESEARMGADVIHLGWNVTNVKVTANGRPLIEGTDYQLDELAGIINIINTAYTRPDQNIVVTYETPQLFQLRKKTFAGVTADLALWENSKLGAAAIYFNEETAERKIRLGNEPIKNVVLDLNGEFHFKPKLMTDMMDALPFIEADEPSKIDVQTEYAVVLPDPNPANNPATGDDNGVAYVDDFESSKQEIPIPLGHTQWFLSSQPEGEVLGYPGRMGWYNPRDRVPARTIWPDYEESSKEGAQNDIRIFRMQFQPFLLASQTESGSDTNLVGEPTMRARSWAGAYHDFRGAYGDLSEKKFLELTLHPLGDLTGYLHIDLGVISEDTIPNQQLDTEDANNDGTLQSSEDVGLDLRVGADPPWPLPDELFGWSGSEEEMVEEFGEAYGFDIGNAFDFWDINGNSAKDGFEPWSWDNWVRVESGDQPIDNSHGWEGNEEDADQLYPDTEDRNGNRTIDLSNDYFSFRIPLNPADPEYSRYVFTSDRTDWIFVRIPLKDDARIEVGNPQLSVVNGVRLWFTGFDGPLDFELAEFNIVGNEWREAIIANSDTSYHEISVLNNFDNPDNYYSPPGVEGQKDFITGIKSREQSLVIELEDLPFGSTAWSRKQFASPASFTEYRELKMFIHGGAFERDVVDSVFFNQQYGADKIEMLFRIQSTESDFYEYSKFIRGGWASENNVRIILEEITGIEAFAGARREQEEPGKPILLSDGGQVRVEGNPSINQVRALLLGLKNHGSQPAATQVWFNELRVSDVKKEIGRAFRTQLGAAFSDVLSLNAGFEQVDAEYHNVKQRTQHSGRQEFKRNFSFSGRTDLGRLFPPAWGVQANLSADVGRNFNLPKYYPNDDQEVDRKDHPEWVETVSHSRGATLSLKKRDSKHWLARNLVDRSSLDYSISELTGRSKTVAGDTLVKQKFTGNYNSTFTWEHKLRPFGLLANWPIVGRAADFELAYFPKNLSFGGQATRELKDKLDRNGTELHTQVYSLSRNWRTSFQPHTIFSASFGRNYSNNLLFDRRQAEDPQRGPQGSAEDSLNYAEFLERLELWRLQKAGFHDGDYSVTQSADFTFKPRLVGWLNTDFTYNTRYTWQRDLAAPGKGVSLSNDGRFRADLKLRTGDMLQALLFLSDTELSEARTELADRAAERKAEREERRERRRREREQRDAQKEDRDAGGDGDREDAGPTGEPVPPLEPGALDTPPGPVEGSLPEALDQPPARKREIPPQELPAEAAPGDTTDAEGPDAALSDSLAAALEQAASVFRDTAFVDTTLAVPEVPEAQPPDSILAEGAEEAPADTAAAPEESRRGPFRALGSLFRGVRLRAGLLFSGLEDLGITFNRTGTHTDPGAAVFPWTGIWERHAGLAYQLALSNDPGMDTLRISNYQFTTTRNFGYDYSLNTKLKLVPDVPVTLRYDYNFSQSFTNRREASRSEAETGWYVFDNESLLGKGSFGEGDGVGGNPRLLPLPDYRFSIPGLEELPIVGKLVKQAGLSHDYSGRLETGYARGASEQGMYRRSLSLTKSFAPLVGVDYSLEKGWSGQINYNVRRNLSVQDPDFEGRSVSYSVRREWSFSASKTLRKGFRIPWIRKRFENDTTLRLNYSNSTTTEVNSITEQQDEGEQTLVWNTPLTPRDWRLSLNADFKFSRNVTGGLVWEYGVRRSGAANDRISYTDFGVHCTIQIRSR